MEPAAAHRRRTSVRRSRPSLAVRAGAGLLAVLLVACASDGEPATRPKHATTTTRSAARTATEPVGSEVGGWIRLPDWPLTPRTDTTAVWTGQELLMLGGSIDTCPPGANCVGTTERPRSDGAALNPDIGAWRAIADAPIPLGWLETAVAGGDVYVLQHASPGNTGVNGPPAQDASFLRYSPTDDAWTQLPVPTRDDSESWFTLVAAGDDILAGPGSDENGVQPVRRFDPSSGTWADVPDDPLPDLFERSMSFDDGYLYLTGNELVDQPGSDGPTFVLAARLDIEANHWEELPTSESISPGLWAAGHGKLVNPALGGADGGEVNGWGRWYPEGAVFDTEAARDGMHRCTPLLLHLHCPHGPIVPSGGAAEGSAREGSAHAEQVHDEDEGLATLDDTAGAALSVAEVRRDGDLASTTELHAGHALVPARDDLAGAQPEPEAVAPIPRGVELLSGGPGDAHVVDLHGAGAGLGAVSDDQILEHELGRRGFVRDGDLRLLAHGERPYRQIRTSEPLRSVREADPADQGGHLDGDVGAVLADVVATGALRPGEGLVEVLDRERAEGDGHAGLELRLLDPRGALPCDRFVVRGLPPDHAAEAHDRVDPSRQGPRLGGQRQLEGTRNPVLDDVGRGYACSGEASADAVEQAEGDVRVPAGAHDRDGHVSTVELCRRRALGLVITGHGYASPPESGAASSRPSRPSSRWPIFSALVLR